MYNSIEELVRDAEERHLSLWQVILENECRLTQKTQKEVFKRLDAVSYTHLRAHET